MIRRPNNLLTEATCDLSALYESSLWVLGSDRYVLQEEYAAVMYVIMMALNIATDTWSVDRVLQPHDRFLVLCGARTCRPNTEAHENISCRRAVVL